MSNAADHTHADHAEGLGIGPETLPRPQDTLLFEVAWEVCSKVGGIYTVLRTKAPAMVRRWEDHYCLIGPYREGAARVEFEPQEPRGAVREGIVALEVGGARACFGRWLVSGHPQVVLIDIDSVRLRLAEWKYLLWKDCGVGSPEGDTEFDDVVAFGFAVAEFLQAVCRAQGEKPIVAHFHEWQGAAALPPLRHRNIRLATVFTTHATLVGRCLCAANAELYEHLHAIDAAGAAYAHGFGHRHALEGAAAQACDVFTTVSGITALETRQFLGREPDVLLPNGLNVERFAAPHEFQVLHRRAKEAIHEFVMAHFFPSYTFDLDRTLYVFTAGRYEYRNKGLEVFIEALCELNRRMRADGATTTVVAFIITAAPRRGINNDTLNRQAMFRELRDTCDEIKDDMGYRLFHTVAQGRLPTLDELLDQYATVRLKRMMYAWRSSPPPSIVTHDLVDDAHDPVLQHLRSRGLWNLEHDRVKVVFHPEFLTSASPLFGMEYDEFVRGCHVGVFPSYYEPWGYTPLECVVSGIPAITSDLSGFGDYLRQHFPQHDEHGMFVVRRRGQSFEAAVEQVAEWLYRFTRMSRRERITLRNRVEAHAEHFDWYYLSRHYAEAHNLALARKYATQALVPPEQAPAAPVVAAPPDAHAARPEKRAKRSGTRKRTARQ